VQIVVPSNSQLLVAKPRRASRTWVTSAALSSFGDRGIFLLPSPSAEWAPSAATRCARRSGEARLKQQPAPLQAQVHLYGPSLVQVAAGRKRHAGAAVCCSIGRKRLLLNSSSRFGHWNSRPAVRSRPHARSGHPSGKPSIFTMPRAAPAPKPRPNPSVKRTRSGMPPGPGCRYAVHFRQPGPGVMPLRSAYLERWASPKHAFHRA
jgi:hypothetical protein